MNNLVISIAVALLITLSGQFAEASPDELLREYFDALIGNNWEEAETCSHTDALEKSKRFNITYDSVNAKYDCASVLYNIVTDPNIDPKKIEFVIDSTLMHDGFAITFYSLLYPQANTKITARQYSESLNDEIKLVSPQYMICKKWINYKSKYLNIYVSDKSMINAYAIEETDKFIDSALKLLGCSSERIKLLEKTKIDYYLCSKDQFKEITGHDAHGIYDLPSDAIITRHLPHKHELSHLLINYTLQKLPLYTLPVMQEGLAVALGGRWGKSRDVILDFGRVLCHSGFLTPDNIIGYNDFYSAGPADMTYPVSGLILNSIIEEFGIDKFKEYYLKMSGGISKVSSIDIDSFIKHFNVTMSHSWAEQIDKISAYKSGQNSLIERWPDNLVCENPIINADDQTGECKIYQAENIYYFEMAISDSNYAVLLKSINLSIESEYVSSLFKEQIPLEEYNGYRYGLLINAGEIGLYDYYTNELIAKTVAGFYPNSDYANKQNGKFQFSIDSRLFAEKLVDLEIQIIQY